MLAFALIAPLATTLDTLVFNDGMTHHLDGSQVTLADDIVVQGSGGTTQTTVFLVDDAQVAEASLFSHGTLGLRDQSYVAGDVTIHGPYALVHADDEATIGGTLHVAHGAATLAGHSTVGDVEVGLNASLNLNADATISGDLDGQGRVAFHRGRVLGTTTVSHYFTSREPRTEFVGPLITEGGVSMRLHDQRLGSSLTARGSSRIEISGESEVIGTLRAEDQASVTIFVDSADVPTGYLTEAAGVFLALDSAGSHVFYAYEREVGAKILVMRRDDPTSTTVCAQTLPNSTGNAGHVTALGSRLAAAGELILRCEDLPTNSFSFFFVGTELMPGMTQSGDICTGGNIGRFVGPGQIMTTGSTNEISIQIDTTSIPGNPPSAAVPGSTYYFQCWNRDNVGGFATSRFSDTAAVTFE